jgi:sterol desaturase/sphingolipid hydroxylase (fatty acid hydroxylase superfamily)
MFTGTDEQGPSWLLTALSPLGALALMITGLLIEVSALGYERSGLRRLLHPDASARVDLFYVALRLSGGIQLLAFVFSLGTMYYAANAVHRHFGFALVSAIDSVVVQFILVYLVNTLVFYLAHRLMHTRWLWEVHKVHHSATDLNVVTAVRNHPIDFAIMTVVNAFPAALLGADPVVIVAYFLVNGLYQLAVHSELPFTGRVVDAIWITPAAHRIHHSSRPEHWDRNFGILTIWDRLFGTYHPPHLGPLRYGVDGDALINRDAHVHEVFALVRRWLLGRRSGGQP